MGVPQVAHPHHARTVTQQTRAGHDFRNLPRASPRSVWQLSARPTPGGTTGPRRPSLRYLPPTMSSTTWAPTFLISSSERGPLNAVIPPPPLVTCFSAPACSLASGIVVRSGPPLPPRPSAPWQTEHCSGDTSLPAAASTAPPAASPPLASASSPPPLLSSSPLAAGSSSFSSPLAPFSSSAVSSPACAVPFSSASRPFSSSMVPFSENTQKFSPWAVAASELPPA